MTEETMVLLEEQIQKQLKELDSYSEDEAKRSRAVQDLTKMLERMTEAEIANEKWYDNQERRDIERDRNKTMVTVEEQKNRFGVGKTLLEVAKIGVPAAVSLLTLREWRRGFYNMLSFEKDGFFKTTASKEVHLPKLKF